MMGRGGRRAAGGGERLHLHVGSCDRVILDPMTIRPLRARVRATFRRRLSDKKPTLPCSLALTALKMMTSFSCPVCMQTHVMQAT